MKIAAPGIVLTSFLLAAVLGGCGGGGSTSDKDGSVGGPIEAGTLQRLKPIAVSSEGPLGTPIPWDTRDLKKRAKKTDYYAPSKFLLGMGGLSGPGSGLAELGLVLRRGARRLSW